MTNLPRHLIQFRALSYAEQYTLLVAAACIPLFWVGLWLLGLSRVQVWLLRSPVASRELMTLQDMQAIGKLVNIAASHTIGAGTCLTRSLLLWWLLLRRGIESQVRIGVSLTEGVLTAHAWVEFEGVPVNDQPDVSVQFLPFGDLPKSIQ